MTSLTRRQTRSPYGMGTAPFGSCAAIASDAFSCSSARGPAPTSRSWRTTRRQRWPSTWGCVCGGPLAGPFAGSAITSRAGSTGQSDDEPGRELIPFARKLYASLDVGRSTLVHGDFHHHNILDAGGRYLAIDAKAMVGDPEFDVPSFLWNPLQYRMTLDVTERRLAAFAAAGLNEERMRMWSVIRGAYLGADEDEVRVLRALL